MTCLARDTTTTTPHSQRPVAPQIASKRLPGRWRHRLPEPEVYYRQHVTGLGRARDDGWAHGLCPFHDDHTPSLGVNLQGRRGGWICFAGCGKGDLVAFHMSRTGLSFRDAVCDLVEGAR